MNTVPDLDKATALERDESSSRSIFLFEHDLRANASRLSRGKTGTHFSGSCSSTWNHKSVLQPILRDGHGACHRARIRATRWWPPQDEV